MRQLSALDAQFLAIEDDAHYGHVGGLATFSPAAESGGELTLEGIREVLDERMHLLPPMRWRLASVPLNLDHPYWVDDPDFDLSYHLRELALPEPGSDEQLAEQVARIFSRRLDRSRPLWELYVIHGLEGGRKAVLTKIHHAMVDGMSGAEIMGILYDLEPAGREIPPPDPEEVHEHAPGEAEMIGRAIAGMPRQSLRTLRSLPGTLPHIDVAPSILGVPGAETISRVASRARNALGGGDGDGEVISRPRHRAPRVPFSGRISPHRRFSFGTVPLDAVKAVKNAHGVKVNDVVVAVATGGVRRWLLEHDALPDEPLLAQVPVSVRTEQQTGTYGNRVSVMIVPLPTNEADPLKRLERTANALVAAKARHGAMPAELLQDATNFIPPAIHARATRVALRLGASARMRPMMNLVISNVPGPPVPIYMAGAELEANYPVSVITDGTGLNITVMSYRDRMDFGLVADRDQMPDLPTLMQAMRDSLAELDSAAT